MRFVKVAFIVIFLVGTASSSFAQRHVLLARAVLSDSVGKEVGTVLFWQAATDRNLPTPPIIVFARVKSLTPGLHGIHIHETGVCEPPGFTSAGGHFDAGPFGHSTPVDANHPYHSGDLPNLEVDEAGAGQLRTTTSRVTLSENPGNLLSVFDANGSAVIVHQNADLGQNGLIGASGGPRIACGVIQLIEARWLP